jgi:FkbM family methyltransferase
VAAVLPAASRASMLSKLMEDFSPTLTRHGLTFSVPGRYPFLLAYRLKTKEPDTIEWLDRIAPGSVLWDIGANVGIYTIYAASRGVNVYAFEPEAGSFAVLQKNIDLNGQRARVTALNLGLSDTNGLVKFRLFGDAVGLPKHGISDDSDGRTILASTGERLKELGIPSPQYIKIDVDGAERAVMNGLSLDDVKEVQIELRDKGDDAQVIYRRMTSEGFVPDKDIESVVAKKGKAVNVLFRRS